MKMNTFSFKFKTLKSVLAVLRIHVLVQVIVGVLAFMGKDSYCIQTKKPNGVGLRLLHLFGSFDPFNSLGVYVLLHKGGFFAWGKSKGLVVHDLLDD